eukprot:CAMPEP_0174954356 /NCGR_PEP_ID=MMETSP0004_2-20121128/377_1 /TAXON_ID=420556 /ORGANISM="Ochromonas sp., Strain CCMP1393" /LENGTH=188 /DNA_ID=CAMNT_0016202157 /DNA_START=36 /DNA_END=598 /DNA_ORIENTATION=+
MQETCAGVEVEASDDSNSKSKRKRNNESNGCPNFTYSSPPPDKLLKGESQGDSNAPGTCSPHSIEMKCMLEEDPSISASLNEDADEEKEQVDPNAGGDDSMDIEDEIVEVQAEECKLDSDPRDCRRNPHVQHHVPECNDSNRASPACGQVPAPMPAQVPASKSSVGGIRISNNERTDTTTAPAAAPAA